MARLGLASRARVTQIMSLLNLAPDLQEQLLDLPAVENGRAVVTEHRLREIVAELDWGVQWGMWENGEGGCGVRAVITRMAIRDGWPLG